MLVKRKMVKYVLIIPCCGSLRWVDTLIHVDESPIGPDFSSHVWSRSCVAIDCPRVRLNLGIMRWIVDGKNPSIFEKW